MKQRLPLLGLLVALAACSSSPSDTPSDSDTSGDTGVTDADSDGSEDADTSVAPDTDAADADTTDDADTLDDVDTDEDTGPDVDPTIDSDGDRILDIDEITIWHTDPRVVDTDGDGFDDGVEILDFAFDPDVNNFQFNPLIADRPEIRVGLASAPVIYATYTTSTGESHSIGRERGEELSETSSRSWGGSNSYGIEQTNTVGASAGFEGWSFTASVSYEYSETRSQEWTQEWSQEQETSHAQSFAESQAYESSTALETSGGMFRVATEVSWAGDIAYRLDALDIQVSQFDPLRPMNAIPVATLTYAGDELGFALSSENPQLDLTFESELDLPTVHALLRDSRNLIFKPSLRISNENYGDLELTDMAVRTRTAEVIIDYGFDREPESYRIAVPTGELAGTLTAGEALTRILRIPWEQGTFNYTFAPDADSRETVLSPTRVRDFGVSDDDAVIWTVIHNYVTESGASTATDQYHPLDQAVDLNTLILNKGDTLQLVRIVDVDRDGLGERSEYAFGSDPENWDTDGDGCSDGFEVVGQVADSGEIFRSDPTMVNTDHDAYDDCEEYTLGTDPSDSDNLPPTIDATVDTADGIRAVFAATFSDPDGTVQSVHYSVDGGEEASMDVAGMDGSASVELFFSTAGRHDVTFRAFDGQLYSDAVTASYTVGVPSGSAHQWPIQGTQDGTYYGNVGDLTAEPVVFSTGRDGAGRGGADMYYDGTQGILYGGPYTIGLDATFSQWVRFDGVYSETAVMGQSGLVGITAGPSGFGVHDLSSQIYLGPSNRVINAPYSGFIGTDTYVLLTVTVADGTATLYVNGEAQGTGPIGATEAPYCIIFYGYPHNGEATCTYMQRPEDYESHLDAVFDDLYVWPRALTANEVEALYLN